MRKLKIVVLKKALIAREESGRADYFLTRLIEELDQDSVDNSYISCRQAKKHS